MLQFIAFIIFIFSSGILLFIVYRKIPLLIKLPENGYHGLKKPKFISSVESKLKDFHFYFFEKKVLSQKVLSRFRVLVLRAERIIDNLLNSIREKAKELDKKNGRK